MSRPARAVAPGDTVASAMALCQRYSQSGVLVTEDDRLVGSVGREDLDRAIGHGLSHAPVKGIMSGRALTAGPDAPLDELQRLLSESTEGRIAIVDGEAVEPALLGEVERGSPQRPLGLESAGGTSVGDDT